MATAPVISPNPPQNKGLDYAYLRSEGVRLVQQLSGSTWTDYNEHDPGVTTLEQLCYALTELSYRAELPMADILGDPETGEIDTRLHGLYTARRILPCNPVICQDYRKLLVDRVPGVANAWMYPRIPGIGSREVNGIYDIVVYAPNLPDDHRHEPDCGPRPPSPERRRLLRRVRRVYNRHRNLCEDLRRIHILEPLRTLVHADVAVKGAAPVEKTLAKIFFGIGALIAPELRRQPLSALIDAGESPDRIFNGPLLRRGFIDDAELQPPIASMPVNEILAVIAQTAGVASVKEIEVRAGHSDTVYGLNSSIAVPHGRILRLDTTPAAAGKRFSIRLLRNGVACSPDPDAVRRELNLLWIAYRRSYPLAAQYSEYFGIPNGRKCNLERYYSIQNQYPPVYGIGSYGLPVDATPERRGQAKQLKGYLLAFEQLMADYLAQLAHARNLFSTHPDPWRTCYCQSLAKSVPDVEPLLRRDYFEGLNSLVASEDAMLDRRDHFAQYLLSLYASELDAISDDSQCRSTRRSRWRLLRARLELLRVLVPATRRRGTGFDYRAEPSPINIAGMELKCRIEMGLDLEQRQTLTDALAQSGLRLVRGRGSWPVYASEARDSGRIEEDFQPIAAFPEPGGIPESSMVLRGTAVTAEFIRSAQDPASLFIGRLPGDESVAIAHRSGSHAGWGLIDVFPDEQSALREAHALFRHLKRIDRARTQLYIVEHTLLRAGRRRRRRDPDDFEYSFTITAVVGLASDVFPDRDNRTMVEQIIRENTPAHIAANVCYLDSCRLLRFERLYHAWRGVLPGGKRFPIALTSARLRRFLERHTHREAA